jgi:hypothetical protein
MHMYRLIGETNCTDLPPLGIPTIIGSADRGEDGHRPSWGWPGGDGGIGAVEVGGVPRGRTQVGSGGIAAGGGRGQSTLAKQDPGGLGPQLATPGRPVPPVLVPVDRGHM